MTSSQARTTKKTAGRKSHCTVPLRQGILLPDLEGPGVRLLPVQAGEALVPGEGDGVAGEHLQVSLPDPGQLQL